MKRLYRILPVLIPLVMLLSCAEYARRRLAGATEQVRRLVVVELSRAMEAPVEVGKVSGSVFGNVRLHDVVVGRDAKLPGGAIFQTKSLTIGLKLIAYLRREVDPANLIAQVELDRPELLVTHASDGYWNVQRWIKREPGKPFQFRGRILVRGGKLNYRDDFLAKRAGVPLVAAVTEVAGTVQFAGEGPVRFTGTGRSGTQLPRAQVTGWLPVHGGAVTVLAKGTDADAAFLARYFLPHPDYKVEGGRADGEIQLSYGQIADSDRRFSYAGDLRLRNGVVSAKRIAPRRATGLNGPVSFRGRHVVLNGVTAQLGATSAKITGTFIAIPSQPQFDLEIESGHASLSELAALARPDGKLSAGGGRLVGDAFAAGRVRVTGRLDDAVVSGAVSVSAATVEHPNYGTLATGPFALKFGSPSYASADFAADFSTPVLDLARVAPHKVSPHFSGLELGQLVNVALKITGFPSHPLVTGDIQAPRVQLGGVAFTNVMASARYHDGFLGLTDGRTEVGGGTARGDVQVQLAEPNPVFGVKAKFERVELRAFNHLFGSVATLQGVAGGELLANGTPRQLALALTTKSDSALAQWEADDPQDAARGARQLRARQLEMEVVGNYERDEQGGWKFGGTAEGTASGVQLPPRPASGQRERVSDAQAQNVKFKVAGDLTGAVATPLAPRLRLGPLAGVVEAERGSATLVAAESGRSARKFDAQALSTEFSSNGEILNLTNLRARVLDANWRAHLDLPLHGGQLIGKFSGDTIDLQRVATAMNVEGLAGSARAQGDLRGTLEAPVLSGEVEGIDVRTKWLARTFGHVHARATWSDNQLTLHEASAWSGGARVVVEGELTEVDLKNSNARLRLTGALTGGDLRDLLATLETKLDTDGVVAAHVEIGGTVKQPNATGRVELARAQFHGAVFDRATAEGTLRGDTWEIAEASAKIGDAQLQGAGTYRDDVGVNARWSLANAPVGLLAQLFGARSQLSGRVTASGTVTGKKMHETVAGGLHVADLRIEGKRFGDLTCAAVIDRTHLEIEQASLKTNGHPRAFAGFFPFKQDASGLNATLQLTHESVLELLTSATTIQRTLAKNDLNPPALQALLDGVRALPQPLEGRVSGEANVTGSWEHPRLAVRAVRVAEPRVGGERLPAVKDADLVWDGERVVFQQLVASDGEESIVLRPDSTWSREKIDLSLKASNVSIRHLRPWLNMERTTEGKINAFISAKGPAAAPQVEATVEATDLVDAALPLESARARLSVNRNELRIHESELVVHRHGVKTGGANVLLVNGTVPVRFQPAGFVTDRPLELHVRAEPQEFTLDPDVAPMLESARGDFAGEVNVTGTIDHPRLGGELSIQGGTVSARSLLARITDLNAHVELDATTNSVRITRAEGKWHLGADEARSSLGAPTETTLRAVTARAPTLVGAAFALTGHAELMAERLFDWRAHHYDLQLQFQGGSLAAPRFSGLHDIRGKITLTTPKDDAHRITIESLTARDAETESLRKGQLTADGTIELLRSPPASGNGGRVGADAFWRGTRLNVNAHATEFIVRQAKLYDATLTGQLELRNDPTDSLPLLKGEIRVTRASVAGFPGQTSLRTTLPRVPKLEVGVSLGSDVLVRNPTFEAQLGGGGMIRGTPTQPDANFQFTARRGTVRFPGTELRVIEAAATAHVTRDADGNLTPLLNVNLRAEGKLDNYRLVLTLDGPVALNDPRRSIEPHFYWDAPAGQNLYTRLLGLPPDDRSGERQQQIVGEHVLAIFQAPLVSGFTEEVRRAFGLQVFGLDYRVGEPTAIQFGKEVTRNLFVLYRKQVSGTTQLNTLRFEYRLKGNLLLGYQTDEREHRLSLDASFRF